MENDFVYWRHPTYPGIKVEEVTGAESYPAPVWREMACQIYCENGRDNYREIGHFSNGAPFLYGETGRISISHCDGLYVVATLPNTPEVELNRYTPRAALGVDAERADRGQAVRLRERFLSAEEAAMIDASDTEANVIAWTIKEAAYKAAFMPGLDFRKEIRIVRMPDFGPPTTAFDPAEFGLPEDAKELPERFFGEVEIVAEGVAPIRLKVYSYRSDEFIVTLCYDPRCAKFGKNQ